MVDFVNGPMGYRRQCNQGWNEVLVKALKIKRQSPGLVIDATAGLGTDAFLLATLGCHVIALERHPIVHALLEDGLSRAAEHPDLAETTARITLKHLSAHVFLHDAQADGMLADAVYLDPMFPERTKSAAVKKGMRYLQTLVGKDPDADALLPLALSIAPRVVVKRPTHAPALAEQKPDIQFPLKRCRFDVYLRP